MYSSKLEVRAQNLLKPTHDHADGANFFRGPKAPYGQGKTMPTERRKAGYSRAWNDAIIFAGKSDQSKVPYKAPITMKCAN